MQQFSLNKQLVLIGGGHANIQVLRKLCMNEYKGLNVILISENYGAIYSGMTPGYIEKFYSLNEITIDLQRLCFNAGATFIKDKVINLDEENQTVHLKENPSILFDVLSINTGSISKNLSIDIKNDAKIIFVKPISTLVSNLKKIDDIIEKSSKKKISIVGGGIAAFELSFALYKRYNGKISLDIISKHILDEKNINITSINKIKKIAKKMSINLISEQVIAINDSEISLGNNEKIQSELVLLSTGASLSSWLAKSNLDKNENFIAVNDNLQSLNYKNIFISGDAASIENFKRPKSGIMAVRQGEILINNLFLFIQNKPLKKFKPQKNWLYLIGTYKNSAILNYFNLSIESNWCWFLKKKIDLNFMKKFTFPDKKEMKKKFHLLDEIKDELPKMNCQGCGSKVSKNTLVNFISNQKNNNELSDATKIKFKQSEILQTIDYITLFKSLNPYDFGIISYLHSQNDILAAGGSVHSLSIALGVPFSEGFIEKFYLEYFMLGIQNEAYLDNTLIAAGHSYQTSEPAVTITMNGEIKKSINKSFAEQGDLIYLSKPLGTGYLIAAYYQNSRLMQISDFKKIIQHLKKDNRFAAGAGISIKTKVMTDISGFGLASHLADICQSSQLTAQIRLKKDLLINDNIQILKKYKSSGYQNNIQAVSSMVLIDNHNLYQNILYDPQTNGPLLIVVKEKFKQEFEKIFLSAGEPKPIYIGKFISNQNNYLIEVIE